MPCRPTDDAPSHDALAAPSRWIYTVHINVTVNMFILASLLIDSICIWCNLVLI